MTSVLLCSYLLVNIADVLLRSNIQLKWNLNYAGIAQMWRGGCIIKVRVFTSEYSRDFIHIGFSSLQSVFLGDITSAYHKKPELESLLFDDFFNKGTSSRACLSTFSYLIPCSL